MFNLVIAFMCSASISLIFKFNENRNYNRYIVTSFNYLIAIVMGIVFSLSVHYPGMESLGMVFKKIMGNIPLNDIESMTWAVSVGLVTGSLFYMTFVAYQMNVRKYGPSITGMFGKLGILVPMVFSIFVFKEYPSGIQSAGIILSLFSIVLINLTRDFKWELKGFLILFFLLGGIAEFMNKIFQKYSLIEYKAIFLLIVFSMAFIISLIKTIPLIKKIKWQEIIAGIMVGVPNYFSSYFLINALRDLPTSVVFPVYSAGSILMITIFSHYFFKERFDTKKVVAIALTIIALVLINL